MTAIEKLLQTAKNELGYMEKASFAHLDEKAANAGAKNITKYARDLDALGVYHAKKQGLPWCDIFVDWCFVTAFGLEQGLSITYQPRGGYGAGCTESANYYKQNKAFFRPSVKPHPGDQIFFSNDGGKTMAHTGIVERVDANMVYTIEGNTNPIGGLIANGGMVCSKSYSRQYIRIAGYGRPNYAKIKMGDFMTGQEIVDALTPGEAASIITKALEFQAALDVGALNAKTRAELEEAKVLGLWDGTKPYQLAPRWQMAITALRAYKKAKEG